MHRFQKRASKQIENLRGYVDHLETDAALLADLAANERSQIALARLRDKERELEKQRTELRALRMQRETLTRANVKARLKDLEDALLQEPFDLAKANHALRQVATKIVVNPKEAMLTVHWQHSDQTDEIPFYSRHKQWV